MMAAIGGTCTIKPCALGRISSNGLPDDGAMIALGRDKLLNLIGILNEAGAGIGLPDDQ